MDTPKLSARRLLVAMPQVIETTKLRTPTLWGVRVCTI
jgi:hypothetical protein